MTRELFLLAFVLTLVVPTNYQVMRGVLLTLLLMCTGIAVLRGRWAVDRNVLVLYAMTSAISLVCMVRGAIADGPGALQVGTVFVLWPSVFLAFIGLAQSPAMLLPFMKTIVIASIVASLMGLWVVAEAVGFGVPGGMAFLKSQGASVGVYSGFVEYSLYNMATLIYALPFLVATVLLPGNLCQFSGRWRVVVWCALFLTSVAMLISGRKSFWLIGVLSPAMACGLMVSAGMPMRRFLRRSLGSLVVLALLGLVAIPAFDIKVNALFGDFMSGFDFSGTGSESATIRGDQFLDLTAGWVEKPLLGAGHGTPAPSIIRGVDQPWAYELSYSALLYQAGLIGFLAYAIAVAWVFCAALVLVRHQQSAAGTLIPLLAGLLGFLISNGTNPYLSKFDYLWTLFLPVAAINAYLASFRRSTLSLSTGMQASSCPIA